VSPEDVLVVHAIDRLASYIGDLPRIVAALNKETAVVESVRESLPLMGDDSPMSASMLMITGQEIHDDGSPA
jgi:DNA invertase Pin-like site-specific DNA recombinase